MNIDWNPLPVGNILTPLAIENPAYLVLDALPLQTLELTAHFTVGAAEAADLRLMGIGIADRHFRIECQNGQYLIRDLRSGFGTFVNGTQIAEAYLLEGDHIQIGEHNLSFLRKKRQERRPANLMSRNPAWDYQLSLLCNVARTEFPILLLGPSGSGKEVVAEALHQNSLRAEHPMVRVNCSALSETLVESELFGHLKGSFTGAIQDRKGAFEAARGGTLFLDEIGDLPLTMQAKLLRALENGEIRPVGSDRTLQTNVRILAATHQNLKSKIAGGAFRADLYFRLNVVAIHTPSLVDRLEDFDDLLYQFAKKMRVRFSFAAIQKLKTWKWPGNIRELKNAVARASALYPGQTIMEDHIERLLESNSLEAKLHEAHVPHSFPLMKEMEKQMILKHLIQNHGNQRRTALQLGIPKSTLYDRIRHYQIDPRQFAAGT